MKFKSIFIIGALAFSFGSLQAATTLPTGPTAPPPAELFQNQQSVLELIGTEVWNLQNEKLGRVKFITADLENGRLIEVVVGSGGFLGFGRRVTSIPPRALTLDPHRQIMRLNVTKARFDAAPRFDPSDVAAYSNRHRVAAVLRYYGLQPWFRVDGEAGGKGATLLNLAHVKRTNDILGLQIKSLTGEYLGQVGGLLLDLPKGVINNVVNDAQAMDGSSSYLLRPTALRYNAAHTGLVLNETFAAVKNEPHYKKIGGTRASFEKEAPGKRTVPAAR
ncbi:MAG: photosystem reaction center subunit [Prosthecobacter sp.]|nr:photosystem reaction center subunit [Prosthecobacter sp.]